MGMRISYVRGTIVHMAHCWARSLGECSAKALAWRSDKRSITELRLKVSEAEQKEQQYQALRPASPASP